LSSKLSAGAQGVIFNLSDGGGIRSFAQQAKRNQIHIANIWDSPPWFTPFDVNECWTVYAQPEEFSANKAATAKLLTLITEKFGAARWRGLPAMTATRSMSNAVRRETQRLPSFQRSSSSAISLACEAASHPSKPQPRC
jgi:hypothetical protein